MNMYQYEAGYDEGRAAALNWADGPYHVKEPRNPHDANPSRRAGWAAGYRAGLNIAFPDDGAEQRAERNFGC